MPCSPCGPRRPGRPLCARRALRPGRARYALDTLNTLFALRPRRSGCTLGAGRARYTLDALLALRPRRPGRPLCARRALRPGLAGGALGAGFAARAHGAAQHGHLHRALRTAGDAAAHAVRKKYTIVHESSPLFSGSFTRYHIYAPACRACAPQRRAAAIVVSARPLSSFLLLYKIKQGKTAARMSCRCAVSGCGAVATVARAFFIFVERRLLLIDPAPSLWLPVRFCINNKAKPSPCPVVSSG